MNNSFVRRHLALLGATAATFFMTLAFCLPLQAQTNSRGEEFFIISSVDQKTHQVVLMRPTQLTVAADVTSKTVCLGEDGKSMNPNSLQAGDTVWAVLKGKSGAESVARIREGAMSETELHKLYLHYSVPTPSTPPPMPVKPSPLTPRPQTGTAQPPAAAPPVPNGSNAMLRGQHRLGERHHRPHGPGAPARSNP